jgi:3-oxoacyl-[acyl-carrier protein] reductase
MDLGLRERGCIVTGASSGIGRATAQLLAEEGASLLLVGRRQQELARTAQQCLERGAIQATTLALDVTAPTAAQQIVTACVEGLGRLDVLVNNAGGSGVRTLEQLRDEDWLQQWDLHVMGPMRLMRAAAPVMAARGWGRIVNVASSAGKRPSRISMAYSVTKAAELSLSRSFAELYAEQGVLINAVAPGPASSEAWVDDGGLADQIAKLGGQSREQVLAQRAAAVPRGRYGTSEEIASVIVFQCSQQASNVVGAAWSVDGGTVAVII